MRSVLRITWRNHLAKITMPSVLHVVEPALRFGLFRTLEQLLCRVSVDRLEQSVVAMAPGAVPGDEDRLLGRISHHFSLPALQGPFLRRAIEQANPSVIHAWGSHAAASVAAAGPQQPWVASLDMEHLSGRRERKWLAVLRDESSLAVVCPSDMVKRRLVEVGLRMEACAVVRPGVDQGAIGAAAKHFSREDLSHNGDRALGDDGPIMLVSGPPTRRDGQYNVLWAAALLQHVYAGIRVIVPGRSVESDRFRRFVRTVRLPDLLYVPPERCRWEQLLAIADLVVFAPDGDMGSTPVAWGRAAGVPLLAAGTHATSVVLADRHNAVLCRPGLPRLLANRILTLFEDRISRSKITNEARAGAFEVFGLRRCLDQHLAVYKNRLDGRPVGEGIKDSAILA